MKKRLSVGLVFFLVISAAHTQGVAHTQNVVSTQSTGPVSQMDQAVKALAGDIHKKLVAEQVRKAAVIPGKSLPKTMTAQPI